MPVWGEPSVAVISTSLVQVIAVSPVQQRSATKLRTKAQHSDQWLQTTYETECCPQWGRKPVRSTKSRGFKVLSCYECPVSADSKPQDTDGKVNGASSKESPDKSKAEIICSSLITVRTSLGIISFLDASQETKPLVSVGAVSVQKCVDLLSDLYSLLVVTST